MKYQIYSTMFAVILKRDGGYDVVMIGTSNNGSEVASELNKEHAERILEDANALLNDRYDNLDNEVLTMEAVDTDA